MAKHSSSGEMPKRQGADPHKSAGKMPLTVNNTRQRAATAGWSGEYKANATNAKAPVGRQVRAAVGFDGRVSGNAVPGRAVTPTQPASGYVHGSMGGNVRKNTVREPVDYQRPELKPKHHSAKPVPEKSATPKR